MGRYAGKLKGLRLAKEDNLRTAQDARHAEAYARSADEYNYNKGRRGLLAEQDNLNLDYAKKRNAGLVQNQEWREQDRTRQEKMYAQQEQERSDELETNMMNEGYLDIVAKGSAGLLDQSDIDAFNSKGKIRISGANPKYDSNNRFAGLEIAHEDGSKKLITPGMARFAINRYSKIKKAENDASLANEDREMKKRETESRIAVNEAKATGKEANPEKEQMLRFKTRPGDGLFESLLPKFGIQANEIYDDKGKYNSTGAQYLDTAQYYYQQGYDPEEAAQMAAKNILQSQHDSTRNSFQALSAKQNRTPEENAQLEQLAAEYSQRAKSLNYLNQGNERGAQGRGLMSRVPGNTPQNQPITGGNQEDQVVSTYMKALEWAKRNLNDPRSKAILEKLKNINTAMTQN
ncbi:MAG: hypothetical protein A2020_12205 [Lentisphaerae bacterium GWF2_45_14]|nr:MAG: hypothetical protein A2020_12205 [Lentisphaerae bacterium GWF2_45_14]